MSVSCCFELFAGERAFGSLYDPRIAADDKEQVRV
jgi:hypothetical protein